MPGKVEPRPAPIWVGDLIIYILVNRCSYPLVPDNERARTSEGRPLACIRRTVTLVGNASNPWISLGRNTATLGYGVFRRSASELLRPPSMPICITATAIITAAVTRCTTASVVLFGKANK
jgi:hypothetical protein